MAKHRTAGQVGETKEDHMDKPIERCPKCERMPEQWTDPPRYKSSQMFWIGCRACHELEGGKSATLAKWNWSRRVWRIKYEMVHS